MTSPNDPELQPWSTSFRFVTDDARVSQINKLNKEMKPLDFIVAGFNRDLRVSRDVA